MFYCGHSYNFHNNFNSILYQRKEETDIKIEVELGDRAYIFNSNKLEYDEIGFKDKFMYPLRFAINSDLLKANHFVITIDKI